MRWILLSLLFFFPHLPAWAEIPGPSALPAEVRASLQEGVEAWNRGDLNGFMKGYLSSPDMTFTAGGRLVRGYDALQKRYQDTYGSGHESMGQLHFEDIEVSPLGPDHALAVGRWVLELTNKNLGKETLQGIFSLVLRKTSDGWRILHDHTSRDEKEKK